MRYCIRCGNKNMENAAVCQHCGAQLRTDVSKPQVIQSETPALSIEKLNHSNSLIDDGHLTEIDSERDFFFVLSEKLNFLTTEYKVLNSIRSSGLLACKRITYNGKTALYYCTEPYKSLEVLLPTLDANRFLNILENILRQIFDIKENGFLNDAKIDARVHRIYVDSSNGRVYLTYLPINERCYPDGMYLERQLRRELAYVIRNLSGIQASNVMNLAQLLEEPGCSFGNLMSAIRQFRSVSTSTGKY